MLLPTAEPEKQIPFGNDKQSSGLQPVFGDDGEEKLLVVAGEAGVGLVEGGVFDADAATSHLDELLRGLLVEVSR